MIRMAAADKPSDERIGKWDMHYYCGVVYKHGLYMRCALHNGILKVALFIAENLRTGGNLPVFELFIDKENRKFITYDCLREKWLTAKLDMLPLPGYVFTSEKKWMSEADKKTVSQYLGETRSGYEGLINFQLKIRKDAVTMRHRRETDGWDNDLSQTPGLPKDWEHWVNKVGIKENYIFYVYSKKGVHTGHCSFCGKDVPIKQPRHNKTGRCPRCRHDITYKAVGKTGNLFTEKHRFYLIQRCESGFIVRQFRGYRCHGNGRYENPRVSHWEERRVIFSGLHEIPNTYDWYLYKNQYFRWVKFGPLNPSWSVWGSNNYPGTVYGKTLPDLGKKELSRSGLLQMLQRESMLDPEFFLTVLRVVPELELIAKAGLTNLAKECMKDCYAFAENFSQHDANSLTKLLGINNQELKRLRNNNGGIGFLKWLQFEKATGRPIPDKVINWYCQQGIEAKDLRFILPRMSIVQIQNYLSRQMVEIGEECSQVLTTWADYLSMANRLGYDTNDKLIYRVRKLRQRHDEVIKLLSSGKDNALRAGKILDKYPHVEEIFKSIKEKYEYADEEYAVVVPSRIEDVLMEGQALQHCAHTADRYWERIENRIAYVFFLRKTAKIDKSYYTLEVEPSGTIRQKRTTGDRQLPDIKDAEQFLKKWQAVVSKRLSDEDKELGKRSRENRIIEYAQLREKGTVINTRDLQGALLVDVLMADLMEVAA